MIRTAVSLQIWTTALLAVATVAASARAAGAAVPSPKVQQRIDALLKRRLRPEALPVDPPNPFDLPNGRIREFSPDPASRPAMQNTVATAPAAAENPALGADPSGAEALAATAGRLKMGGVIILKDQIHLVINGVPRREGDMIPADWNNALIYLRVVRLQSTQVVLRYRDAEWTYKFEARR